MTCIVALKEHGEVYLAGDRMGSNSYTYTIYDKPKVFVNGAFAFGYTTSFRMGQLLEHHWNCPPKLETQTEDSYIYVSVLNSIKMLFDEKGISGGSFIMVYNNRIFHIQDDYGMFEINHYVSVGCGYDEAEAALFVLDEINSEMAPEDKLKLAIKAASSRKCGVSEECDVLKYGEK